jgi:hypothetical protein
VSWAKEAKKSLTPEEVIMVAHAHLICGVKQHHLASMYGVDSGRVAEAVVVMREAAENHMRLYRERRTA